MHELFRRYVCGGWFERLRKLRSGAVCGKLRFGNVHKLRSWHVLKLWIERLRKLRARNLPKQHGFGCVRWVLCGILLSHNPRCRVFQVCELCLWHVLDGFIRCVHELFGGYVPDEHGLDEL